MDSFVSRPRRTIIPTEKAKPAERVKPTSEYEESPQNLPSKNKKIASSNKPPSPRLPTPDPLDSVPTTRPVPKPRKVNSPIWNEQYHIFPEEGGPLLDIAGHKLFRCRLCHERTQPAWYIGRESPRGKSCSCRVAFILAGLVPQVCSLTSTRIECNNSSSSSSARRASQM
jgi:hypothetical protein